MTKASLICQILEKHKNCTSTLHNIFEEKMIKVKEDGCFSIFNYDILADFSDPVVQEARGIIIDTDKNEVVCWPFRKFSNFHEVSADTIDWASARVQEKVDGSIIKLWYNFVLERWNFSSNSCIYASSASVQAGISIQALIESAINYNILHDKLDTLNKEYTYIFELVGPLNQVVVRYPVTMLYHLGTRSNITGEEIDMDLGIKKPKEYPLHSLEDCIEAAKQLNKNDYPDSEGFVVVDKNWHRVKVKAPEYLIYHHAVNNGQITKDRAWGILTSDDFKLDTFLEAAPEQVKDIILYYRECFAEEKASALIAIVWARNLAEKGFSRKEIAAKVSNSKYSFFCFKSLDCKDSPEEIVKVNSKKLMNNIKEYSYV